LLLQVYGTLTLHIITITSSAEAETS